MRTLREAARGMADAPPSARSRTARGTAGAPPEAAAPLVYAAASSIAGAPAATPADANRKHCTLRTL